MICKIWGPFIPWDFKLMCVYLEFLGWWWFANAWSNIILQGNIPRGITAHSPWGPGRGMQVWTKTVSYPEPRFIFLSTPHLTLNFQSVCRNKVGGRGGNTVEWGRGNQSWVQKTQTTRSEKCPLADTHDCQEETAKESRERRNCSPVLSTRKVSDAPANLQGKKSPAWRESGSNDAQVDREQN